MSINLAWVIVTFGNPLEAVSLVETLGEAPGLRFILVGNKAGDAAVISRLLSKRDDVCVIDGGHNPGYLGALNEISPRLGPHEWVVLSNADLVPAPGCVDALMSLAVDQDVAMIAPSIVAAGRDQNPYLMTFPPARKLKALKWLHRWPWVADLMLLRSRGHSARPVSSDGHMAGDKVCAGHGSCLIFTPEYRRRGGRWDYPARLFGEELWCAAELVRIQAEWVYEPTVKLMHTEHSTTGSRRRRGDVARWKYESLVFWSNFATAQGWR